MSRFQGRALGLLGIGMIAAAGAGATITYLLVQPPTPESLERPATASFAPVVAQEFTDPRTIDLVIQPGVAVNLRVARAGVLTSSACTVGGSTSSGRSTFSVDGVPLLDLHTTLPLWRELRDGDRGPDVDAVKAELARLGLRVSSSSRFSSLDLSSIAVLRHESADAVEALSPADLVWLPTPDIIFSSCDAGTNSRVEDGGLVGTVDGGESVALGPSPPGLIPGARTLTVDTVALSLDESLVFADPFAAQSLATTAAYREAAGESDPGSPVGLTASIRLTVPLAAWALPPTALTVEEGTQACVTADDGTAHRVTILASQLGSTVVAFDGDAPESVRLGVESECA